jgi:hypothetical protein
MLTIDIKLHKKSVKLHILALDYLCRQCYNYNEDFKLSFNVRGNVRDQQ